MTGKPNEHKEKGGMPFLQHLEELRWHLIRSLAAIVIGGVVLFVNKTFVFDWIVFAPKSGDFFTFRVLCHLSEHLHNLAPELISRDAICIGQDLADLQNIRMAGQFMMHLLVSLVGGFIIAFPYVFWEIWRFVTPALRSSEKKHIRGVVLSSSGLFMMGVIFGYFVIAPLSINFFLTYEVSEAVINNPTLNTYVTTVVTVVLACGLIFQLPVIIYFLTKLGLITPAFMKKFRKHAFVTSLILSAIITPPDIFSQLLVCVPLIGLYEISIRLSALIIRNQKKKLA